MSEYTSKKAPFFFPFLHRKLLTFLSSWICVFLPGFGSGSDHVDKLRWRCFEPSGGWWCRGAANLEDVKGTAERHAPSDERWWIPGVWRRWREISPLPTSSWSSFPQILFFFSFFFVGKRTQRVEDLVTSFASFLLAVFCFFSKNWSEPIFLPQSSWGVETQSAFQCPRNFRSLGRILFGSSMSCFSGTVWNWCAWIWPSCSGFWWVPSLSWMSGISARRLDSIMGFWNGRFRKICRSFETNSQEVVWLFLISYHILTHARLPGAWYLCLRADWSCQMQAGVLLYLWAFFVVGVLNFWILWKRATFPSKSKLADFDTSFFGGCQMVRSVNDFDWSKQLRYYWATEDAGGSLWGAGRCRLSMDLKDCSETMSLAKFHYTFTSWLRFFFEKNLFWIEHDTNWYTVNN